MRFDGANMMRYALITALVCSFAGCGSNSSDQPKNTAGIPLSIRNPTTEATDEAESVKDVESVETLVSPEVQQLMKRAEQAAASGQHAVAIEALSQAIGVEPQNSVLFQRRAESYSALGENASARADYSLAIQADSENAELYNARGYFMMAHGVSDAAIADFEQAIKFDPQLAAAWNNRGLVYLALNNLDQALADFNKAIEARPNYADALNNRGFTKMKSGDLAGALVDLKASLKNNAEYTTAWNNCGLVYLKQEKFEDAVAAFSEAVRLAPLDARWLNHRRTAYMQLERFEEANADARRIQWLTKLQQLSQQAAGNAAAAESWLARASHFAEGGEFAAAVEDYSRALKIEPANTVALNGRAEALLTAGKIREAIADCDVSLVTQPSTTAFSIRGDAWYALGNYTQAIEDFQAAKRFDEAVADAYRKRAAERKQQGQEDEAQVDLARASEISAALAGQTAAVPEQSPIPFPEQ